MSNETPSPWLKAVNHHVSNSGMVSRTLTVIRRPTIALGKVCDVFSSLTAAAIHDGRRKSVTIALDSIIVIDVRQRLSTLDVGIGFESLSTLAIAVVSLPPSSPPCLSYADARGWSGSYSWPAGVGSRTEAKRTGGDHGVTWLLGSNIRFVILIY